MEGDHTKINYWLLPLSWLYGLVVGIRNLMFDYGVLKSKKFPLSVICVGNLTVGGTGKTPHTEYLIRLLAKQCQVAVLSRGYKRESKGYVLATKQTKMTDIGDEPFQMKRKFPKIHMAVDKNRCHGIEQLMMSNLRPPTDVVILDDAFQHRYVKAGLNILLMDYHRLVYFDKLLPAGRLREPQSGIRRADIVIITKCPRYITPMDRRGIERTLALQNWQDLFFTTYRYPDTLEGLGDNPLLVTGIASPQQMVYDLQKLLPKFDVMSFPDHHNFTPRDIEKIRQQAAGRTIITTEKDATRLHGIPNLRVIPIQVEFLDGRQADFDALIQNYVNSKTQKLKNLKT
ncbi:MAG: tetraacyldisaccharide 4'-kinase [Bacteroidaceae bacterium]|nr:tetraacyldisaccharide 4'-kinase [Bacteroidaceae bacterium]